jgi:hypothetical protein
MKKFIIIAAMAMIGLNVFGAEIQHISIHVSNLNTTDILVTILESDDDKSVSSITSTIGEYKGLDFTDFEVTADNTYSISAMHHQGAPTEVKVNITAETIDGNITLLNETITIPAGMVLWVEIDERLDVEFYFKIK